jgi:hypothetical protein
VSGAGIVSAWSVPLGRGSGGGPVQGWGEEFLRWWLDEARAAVGPLPSLPARRAVYALCDAVAARIS